MFDQTNADQSKDDIKGFDEPSPSRKPMRLRRWLIGAGAVALLAGGASLIVPGLLDQAKYKALIQEKVTEATGYKVDWTGDIGVSILPLPSVSLNNLTLVSGSTTVLSLKEADVRVALMPLLSKKIDIISVELNEPDVTLIVDKQGRATWMSEKLSDQAEGEEASTPAQPTSSTEGTTEITLNALKITKGTLTYRDLKAGTEQKIENINTTLRAESLTGPYAAKGDLIYTGKAVGFDLKAGKLDGNQASYPINGKISLPDLKVDGEYAGVIATSPVKVDGELTLAAADLGKTIEAFSGQPASLPPEADGEFQLKGKLLYDEEQVALSAMRIAAGDLAYKGAVSVKNLKSDAPPLTIDLVPEKAGSSPLSNLSVKGTGTYANNRVSISTGTVALNDQKISLSGSYKLPAKEGHRPVIDMKVQATRLNLDELSGAVASVSEVKTDAAPKAAPKAPSGSVSGTSLPFDGELIADIGTLVTNGQTYSPIKADVVSKGNALTVNSLTVGLAGSTVNAKGRIGNLAELSGLDLSGSLKTSDAEALMSSFGVAPPALDRKIGVAEINGSFKGSTQDLAFDATVNALKFSVTGKGAVITPLSEPKISSLDFNVRHPSLSEAVGTFQPGFTAPPSFRGALDLSGKAAWGDDRYTLSGLKGNLGSASIVGDLNIAMSGTPSVTGALSFGDLVFDAAKSGSAGGSSGSGGAPAASGSSGRWSTAAINTDWMKSFNADLTVKAKSITQDLWKLTNANLAFKLNGGTLTVDDMSAGMFDGTVTMAGKADGAASPLKIALTMNAANVNAQKLQSALTSAPSNTVLGTIQSFKVDISSTGASPSALVNALAGQGSMEGRNIIINGIDAAQLAETAKGSFKPLERAGSLFSTFKDGQTQFDTFDAAFDITSGIANFSKLVFDGPRAKIDGKGNVNLPRWTIDLVNTVTVKDTDIPPFDVTVKGPLDNPLQAGGNIIEGYLRDKAQKKVQKLIGKELEKRFGIPLTSGEEPAATPDATAPAAGEGEAAAPAPVQQQITPEEEAVKALQGLFKRR